MIAFNEGVFYDLCTERFLLFMERWKTREVFVGSVGIGGDHPIRIQSMTTSDTRDVRATADQIMRLADAGCEIVRVTVQGKKEAESCGKIKEDLLARGYTIPLVADIHFYPPAALLAAQFVDKIRINPGNFVDRRASFQVIEYDDAAYALELEKIEEEFAPLVQLCKRLKRAMRIGTNHGSLSDRIMNRYGDSPKGMCESAFEFARVCRKYDYHDFVFSMKSSNPVVMIEAYRLLVEEMKKIGWNYPLHLGVTEAGEGEDGRMKSSMGIGTLLLDGLGDTIRVSLTEDPWSEVDPCRRLVRWAGLQKRVGPLVLREKVELKEGLHPQGTVVLQVQSLSDLQEVLKLADAEAKDAPDWVWIEEVSEEAKPILQALMKAGVRVVSQTPCPGALPLSSEPLEVPYVLWMKELVSLPETRPEWILFQPKDFPAARTRALVSALGERELPIVLAASYSCSEEDLLIHASAEIGSCLIDKLVQGVCLLSSARADERRRLSFNLLQAARMRTSKTEYISCPGCGRTLFDLQEVSRRIRGKTAHLPGVKIAIMGCIVNGPGEMADADFGYVGSKTGKVDLYVGKECQEKNIDFADADERLIQLIKAHGKWKEPEYHET